MYLVNIGTSLKNLQKVYKIGAFLRKFLSFFTILFFAASRCPGTADGPCFRMNQRPLIHPFQIYLRRLYTKWHKKFSLLRLCCVTLTSL